MKVHELISMLEKHDPSGDVLIYTTHNGSYLRFEIKVQDGISAQKDGTDIIALELQEKLITYSLK